MQRSANPTPRLRGRRAVEQRRRRLAAEPLCRHCRAKGKAVVAEEWDHIVPLSEGGEDTDDNGQPLCKPCHAIKTAREDTSRQAAANHPLWLKPSAIPLEIVSGPPCSGKTTYIMQSHKPGDIVIDLDSIMTEINPRYRHWSGTLDSGLFNKAIRVRNALLGSLSRMREGKAWFIVSAPTETERRWWQSQLGGTVTLLHPGVDECLVRADKRGTPKAKQGVAAWEKASRSPWIEPKAKVEKQAIGLDGWPVA